MFTDTVPRTRNNLRLQVRSIILYETKFFHLSIKKQKHFRFLFRGLSARTQRATSNT